MKKKNRKNDNLNVATSQFSPFPIFWKKGLYGDKYRGKMS
jgi:hypothetical protein